ncbi:hypothetical protein EBI01_01385 [Marinomonas rhizomae]|uniref:Lipocalin-like protein n=1 Tax=Marinomonas rhizomae TaxID=491948 RepID=A0A366JFP1_9GAMM|nr:hypothetical protein [Marinomonas rhizomae]RBP85280.1 hypothetical protein DFP80_102277 [Marinomonas rhizomae]RNF76376.1 hypothetical protein EBI01_01385 [Marinomonas rhizomae]
MKKLIGVGVVAAIAFSTSAYASNDVLAGKWVLQDAGSTQATLDEAVENVAQEMNFFIRALARPVLKKQTQICQQWSLGWQTSQFQFQCDEAEADTIPLTANGEVIKKDEEGIEISGTYQQTNDAVVVVLESERGKRTNTWKQVGENELLFTVKLESEKLPTPLTWSLNYKKQ